MFNLRRKNDDTKVLSSDEVLHITYDNNKGRYVNTMCDLVICNKNADDKKHFQDEYDNAVNFFVNLFNTYFGDELINQDIFDDYTHNVDGFKETFCREANERDDVRFFLSKPTIDGIVYVNRSASSAHFHVNDKIIKGSEFVYTLVRNKYFNKDNFDSIFEGKDIEWAYEVLKQMKLLSLRSELEQKVTDYRRLVQIKDDYFQSVICKMLITEPNKDIAIRRATIFASYFGVPFNFTELLGLNCDIKLIKKCVDK